MGRWNLPQFLGSNSSRFFVFCSVLSVMCLLGVFLVQFGLEAPGGQYPVMRRTWDSGNVNWGSADLQ